MMTDEKLIEALTDRIVASIDKAIVGRRERYKEALADYQKEPKLPNGKPKQFPIMEPLAVFDRTIIESSVRQWLWKLDASMLEGFHIGQHLTINGVSVVPAHMLPEG